MEIKILDYITEDCKNIRTKVFVEEQGFVDEFDEIDDNSFHCVIFENNTAVAVGRVFLYDRENLIYKIGRIAVLKEHRKNHYGSKVVTSLQNKAIELGAKEIHISSQVRVKEFYKSLGYTEIGDVYSDEGCPHILMIKSIE